MPWWRCGSESGEAGAAPADVQATQDVLASIFAPTNCALASFSTSVGGGDVRSAASLSSVVDTASAAACSSAAPPEKTASATSATRHGDVNASDTLTTWWTRLRKRQPSTPIPRSADVSAPQLVLPSTAISASPMRTTVKTDRVAADATEATAAVAWQSLPKSPLAGYELTREGLVDRLTKPPHTLSATELRSLINELTAVEQKATYDVDRQFGSHACRRSLHGLELLISPALFLTSIYLMTWKTARLYHNALPQDSVLFTRLLALLRLRMPAEQRELVARRNQRLMRATNARVSLSFLSGAGLFALVWVSRPPANVMEEAPDVQTAKELTAHQRHFEAALRWCWCVYYHHPAYASTSGRSGHGSKR
ncbi:hypothetical protein GH5_04956 [Leishmania sp. Ghana 2012 LV757]|uniref:hypothetical protein n=1 Tax=Leishmania sp. Ghana 2012 LV757 TaxID=2803181 RepID=UPI001B534B7A|nr:hypothetical protein GH5_04956 [Leishmania sp. Ghana 2012 LV757]